MIRSMAIWFSVALGAVFLMPMRMRAAETELSKAIAAYLTVSASESPNRNELAEAVAQVFAEFVKGMEEDQVKGIQQLVEAFVGARELHIRLAPYVLLHRLPIDKAQLAMAVAGHLFDVDEEKARKWARVLNDRLGSDSMTGYADLRDIEIRGKAFLERDAMRPLVRFLFQKSPSSALLLFARHHVPGKEELGLSVDDRKITTFLLQAKEGAAGDRISAKDSIQSLDKLAMNEHYWVRLYVVEMMLQNPRLLDQKIVDTLAEDKDQLVVLAVRDMQNPGKYFRHQPIRTPWSEL